MAYDNLPALLPVIDHLDRSIRAVIVSIDRTGADIVLVGGDEERGVTVEGDTEHIHRGQPGGWSQRRFQQRAENTWEHNAADVAAEVDRVAREGGVEIVTAIGDVRARTLLADHLSPATRELLHDVDGPGPGDPDARTRALAAADHARADWFAQRTVELLRQFDHALEHDKALEGVDTVFDVLRQGRVERLLVHPDLDDDRRAWFDVASPTLAGATSEELAGVATSLLDGRLNDAAVRAARGGGAAIEVVPQHGPRAPAGGLGALLR
ncbi:MAG: Vms1/Ankzf1 family peptidyl-tRNA hydrolase [Acidimicrobiia bacterium]|nr:Vms1/Ankzf1 family peptidyl-tRNA hydrolase [Acidimicrobiia bacterium]